MRIISQDNKHSIDFDRSTLWLQDNYLYATTQTGENIVLAKYENPENTALVFGNIHEAYMEKQVTFQINGVIKLG